MTRDHGSIFRRDFRIDPLELVAGDGVFVTAKDGRRYLDAVGGAAVVSIGHGVRGVLRGPLDRFDDITYAYGESFSAPVQEEFAHGILDFVGQGYASVYLVSGGSEANETAVKMARQYWVERGQAGKHKVISRWLSYHGVTLAMLDASGRPSWRRPFEPYLTRGTHIAPPYCHRCPFGLTHPSCELRCADELERQILMEGPESVAAFIVEPIVGTTATGMTPPAEYFRRVREICDRYDVLLIADEVFTGYGRTGEPLALRHWDVTADISTLGKGIGSGYAALGAVLAQPHIVSAFRDGSGQFVHGFTYSGLPASCMVGLSVLDYIRRHDLVMAAGTTGEYLHASLRQLADRHPVISDVRGIGLLAGVEFASPDDQSTPLPGDGEFSRRLAAGIRERGVLVRPGVPGINYGQGGDHIQLTPPYVITHEEIDMIVDALDASLADVGAPGLAIAGT